RKGTSPVRAATASPPTAAARGDNSDLVSLQWMNSVFLLLLKYRTKRSHWRSLIALEPVHLVLRSCSATKYSVFSFLFIHAPLTTTPLLIAWTNFSGEKCATRKAVTLKLGLILFGVIDID